MMALRSPFRSIVILGTFWGFLLFSPIIIWEGSFLYASWYNRTTPIVEVPEDFTLINRIPELPTKYTSSCGSFCYWIRYSTSFNEDDIKLFFQNRNDAYPFGGFGYMVIPPGAKGAKPCMFCAAYERQVTDPSDKSIVVINVVWTPIDDFLPNVIIFFGASWLIVFPSFTAYTVKRVIIWKSVRRDYNRQGV